MTMNERIIEKIKLFISVPRNHAKVSVLAHGGKKVKVKCNAACAHLTKIKKIASVTLNENTHVYEHKHTQTRPTHICKL